MTPNQQYEHEKDVDLAGVFSRVWRSKFRLLMSAIIVTALVFVALQLISPRYRSEARILIRASDSVLVTPGTDGRAVQNDLDDPGIASQVELLQSRAIASKVIDTLDLKSRTEFNNTLGFSPVRTIMSLIGLSDGGRSVTVEDRVIEAYFDRLKVFQADRARVVVVQFWSHDPELAAAVPNLISQEYLKLQEELKRGAGPDELRKLEPEIQRLQESVVAAEAAVADFRESSDLMQGRDNDTLATQELSELSTELSRVRAQLSTAEANAAAVRRALESGSLDAAASVLNSPLIQRLRERQVTLNAQLAELSTTLLSGHPRIQRLRSQVNTLTRQINEEARKIEASLQEEADVARDREQDLVQRRNQLKSEAGRVGRAQVELRSLEREADAQRELLNSYLLRFKEATSRQNREFVPADAYVFSKAQVQSKAYFPKKVPILAATFFGTLVLGAMITLANGMLGASSSAHTPVAAYQSKRDVASDGQSIENRSPASETEPVVQDPDPAPPMVPDMATLADPILPSGVTSSAVTAKSLAMLGRARIAVLSPEGPEASAGTVVLARYLASQSGNVIVVDLTGGGDSTKLMLGRNDLPGIKDVMAGQARFSEAIHGDEASVAHIMPNGSTDAETAAEHATRLPSIIDALQKTYDFVLVDCGSADVGGLTRISNASTVNIVNVIKPDSPMVQMAGTMLTHAGYRAPLVVHATDRERRLAGLEAA